MVNDNHSLGARRPVTVFPYKVSGHNIRERKFWIALTRTCLMPCILGIKSSPPPTRNSTSALPCSSVLYFPCDLVIAQVEWECVIYSEDACIGNTYETLYRVALHSDARCYTSIYLSAFKAFQLPMYRA